eukprot:CAMPEP_0203813316 /NCGR_PEP_ID=MMETSP0115-20131106/4646_1 /ASSEMBLY_ACC=CAM_ASM_000227 /TAXON_ID=33651 /ORGANISM="Bicosoecid sp, Strain ms1" /LENGTH=956 /DNA_ID=CAMNT_0050722179 /DNA_START=368 /DNA_END=3235 /DNA_ORIENTATION=-
MSLVFADSPTAPREEPAIAYADSAFSAAVHADELSVGSPTGPVAADEPLPAKLSDLDGPLGGAVFAHVPPAVATDAPMSPPSRFQTPTPEPSSTPLPRAELPMRKVLVIYTGGTIGMKPSDRGYVCAERYLPETMASLAMLHDPDFELPVALAGSPRKAAKGLAKNKQRGIGDSSKIGAPSPKPPGTPRPEASPRRPASAGSRKATEEAEKGPKVAAAAADDSGGGGSSDDAAAAAGGAGGDSAVAPRAMTREEAVKSQVEWGSGGTSSDEEPAPGRKRGADLLREKARMIHLKGSLSDWLVTPVSEYGLRVMYRVLEYWPLLDSSNMGSKDWVRIATDIAENYDHYDAFVILHGTDTMAYTASALSFMLENLAKTVILTGSQIPLVRPRNDGLSNILGSLNIAGHFDIPEVCVYFGNYLMRGNRTTKMHASALSAFKTPNLRPLAVSGISVDVAWELIRAPTGRKLRLRTGWCDDLMVLRIFPGPFTTLGNSLKPPLRGLVMQSFGAGNAPDADDHLMSALKTATKRGVVVVNITQCGSGEVSAHYATGRALVDCGVIPGGDMTGEAALVKLGWLLGEYKDPDVVRKKMGQNLRGEITVPDEHGTRFSLENGGFVKAVWKTVSAAEREREALAMLGLGEGAAGEDGDGTPQPGKNAVNFISQALMPTLMCSAAASGNLRDVKDMVTDGAAAANCADYDGRTPLHLAACNGHLDIAKFLLSRGADVNATDRFGGRPLGDAVAHNKVEMARLLRNAGGRLGGSPHEVASKLCAFAEEGNVQAITMYADAGADVSGGDYDRRTPLHIAASCGREDVVEVLIKLRAALNARDRFGGTPLRDAITNKRPRVVKMLRDAGASLGMVDVELASALCELAKLNDVDAIALYAAAGADLSAGDYDHRTALHVAVSEGRVAVVEALARLGADRHARDRWGATPLSDASHDVAMSTLLGGVGGVGG